MAKLHQKPRDIRRCAACTRGRYERSGEAWDGRPRYKCSNCGATCTYGHGGFDWDEQAPAFQEKHREA